MIRQLRKGAVLTGSLFCLAFAPSAFAADTDDNRWHLGGEIFLWGADIGGETIAGDVEVPFDEIIENLDMTFMGKLAAQRNKWVLAAEIVYLDVGDTEVLATAPVEISGHLAVDSFITTLGAGYRLIQSDAATVHGVFGARYLDLDLGLTLSIANLPPIERSGSDDFWDAVIGLHGEYRFDDDWALTYYGDIGTGDSDVTWRAAGAINYRFERTALVLGYSHLEWEFDDRAIARELDVDGPYAGIQFRFF